MGRGVRVRILSNLFPEPACSGKMTPLTFLFLAGADVRFYTSTTFTHSKYICADDSRAAISSINFSKTSQILNREAGVVISDDSSGKLVSFVQKMFEYDFSRGMPHAPPRNSFPENDRRICEDKAPVEITPPKYPDYRCDISSGKPYKISDVMDVELIASPDYAFDAVIAPLRNARRSLVLSIYQITDEVFCDGLVALHKRGVELRLFVSNAIFSDGDSRRAKQCYRHLYENGISVRMSHSNCLTYSHQKFWIIDDNDVFVSTGNWSPTDFPAPPFSFPPWPDQQWRISNRDITVHVAGNREVASRFLAVFESDFRQGVDFKP
jgi:phosphatidylserine/phosphatidylglycerophosphate/cardiolipin synthase-like enzyme